MVAPRRGSSRGMLSTTSNAKVPAAKPKKTNAAKPAQPKRQTVNAVMGRAIPGGSLGYTAAANRLVNQEIKNKKIKPREQAAYAKRRLPVLLNQMKAERQRTATRKTYKALDKLRDPNFGLTGKDAKEVGLPASKRNVRQRSMGSGFKN